MPELKPPSAPEIEASILGAILIDSDAIVKVLDLIDKDSFYLSSHKMIFDVMADLFNRNIPIDTVTVYNELKKRQQLSEVGGAAYLSQLSSNIPSSANIEYHAKIILEKAILRNLIKVSNETSKKCYDQTVDAFDIIEETETAIFNVTQNQYRQSEPIKQTAYEALEHIEEAVKGHYQGIKTGLIDLDNLLGGLHNGSFYVLAARPSIGKTALALRISKYVARDRRVFFASLEMPRLHLIVRLISGETNIVFNQLISGKFKSEDKQKVIDAANKVGSLQWETDDSSSITITELRSKCKRLKMEKNISLVVVDYLQLMKAKAESREREISIISNGLKAIAKDLNIPVLALAQLNRTVESRSDKRPTIADLRESGSIEQDADSVMLLHRPEFYEIKTFDDGSDTENKAELIVAKNRNGAVGSIKLHFNKQYAEFNNLAPANGGPTQAVETVVEVLNQ